MEVVKNKLNSMKAQSDLSEERIIRFESALRVSKQQLEAALQEKESLHRKIESVEAQIIDADRKREDVMDKIREIDKTTDSSESRRRVLENRELEGDLSLTKLENRLRLIQNKYSENMVQCEEGQRRLSTLRVEYEKLHTKRMRKETFAKELEEELEKKMKKLRVYEEHNQHTSGEEYQREDHMKLLAGYHQEAEERKECGRINVQRLRRLIDDTQDQIETVQSKTRATKFEFKNAVEIVANQ